MFPLWILAQASCVRPSPSPPPAGPLLPPGGRRPSLPPSGQSGQIRFSSQTKDHKRELGTNRPKKVVLVPNSKEQQTAVGGLEPASPEAPPPFIAQQK